MWPSESVSSLYGKERWRCCWWWQHCKQMYQTDTIRHKKTQTREVFYQQPARSKGKYKLDSELCWFSCAFPEFYRNARANITVRIITVTILPERNHRGSVALVLCYQWCFPALHLALTRAHIMQYRCQPTRWRLWVIRSFVLVIKFYGVWTIIDTIFMSSVVLCRDAPFVCFIGMERKYSPSKINQKIDRNRTHSIHNALRIIKCLESCFTGHWQNYRDRQNLLPSENVW